MKSIRASTRLSPPWRFARHPICAKLARQLIKQSLQSRARMDFSIPQEYLDFKAAVYQFAKQRLAPRAQELDARGEFSWENWRDMAGMGLLGLPFPEKYG